MGCVFLMFVGKKHEKNESYTENCLYFPGKRLYNNKVKDVPWALPSFQKKINPQECEIDMASHGNRSGAARAAAREGRAARRAEEKIRRRKADRGETVFGFFLRIGIIFAVFFVMYFVLLNCGTEVEEFEITGNRFISDNDIISLSGISIGDELFRTDTGAAEKQITMHVMIDEVSVRVRPFDKILIEVTEKDAVAGFTVDDTYFYIDGEKVVTGESDTVDENLPLLSGFELPSYISIGLPLEDPLLDNDLEIAAAAEGHFDGYQMEIVAQSESVNNIYLNGIEVRLGSLTRLEKKMEVLDSLIHSMSVQKLESLDYIDVSVPGEPVAMERPVDGEDNGDGSGEAAEAESSDEQPSKKENQRDTSERE